MWETWRPYAWIILIGFFVYARTLFFDFTYLDDNKLIIDNHAFLSNLSNASHAFRQGALEGPGGSGAYYRPILTVSLMFDTYLGGISPFVYHLTNIILHLLASCLLFLFLTKLNYRKEPALFFSLVFSIHPVLTQAVAWIPGRNDVLLTIFVILSFMSFLNFLEKNKPKDYLWHICFLTAALFTKENAIFLIAVCIFYLHFIARKKMFSFNGKILMPGWLIAMGFWFFIRKAALLNPVEITAFDMARQATRNLSALIQFIGKLIFPVNLSVLPIIQDTTFFYGFIAIILVTIILFFSKNMRYNFAVFGALWFFLFLLS